MAPVRNQQKLSGRRSDDTRKVTLQAPGGNSTSTSAVIKAENDTTSQRTSKPATNPIDHEIRRFLKENRWVIGSNSRLGLNHVWRGGGSGAVPSTNFNMEEFLKLRQYLITFQQLELPDPSEHMGARLLGHHECLATLNQFCGSFLELWRVRDDEAWKVPDNDWQMKRRTDKPPEDHDQLVATALYYTLGQGRMDKKQTSDRARGKLFRSLPEDLRVSTYTKFGIMDSSDLLQRMREYTSTDLKVLPWLSPRDSDEVAIVSVVCRWFVQIRAMGDEELQNVLRTIENDQGEVMYCQPELLHHDISFAEGSRLKGKRPRTTPHGVFDYGNCLKGPWPRKQRS